MVTVEYFRELVIQTGEERRDCDICDPLIGKEWDILDSGLSYISDYLFNLNLKVLEELDNDKIFELHHKLTNYQGRYSRDY